MWGKNIFKFPHATASHSILRIHLTVPSSHRPYGAWTIAAGRACGRAEWSSPTRVSINMTRRTFNLCRTPLIAWSVRVSVNRMTMFTYFAYSRARLRTDAQASTDHRCCDVRGRSCRMQASISRWQAPHKVNLPAGSRSFTSPRASLSPEHKADIHMTFEVERTEELDDHPSSINGSRRDRSKTHGPSGLEGPTWRQAAS